MTGTRIFNAGVALVGLLAVGTSARAETRDTPIAVPVMGTQGLASLYPSAIRLAARGGQTHESAISVVLHAVTYPCPEELAILLVHNDDKYLLMSNAGGCRPLQGTTMRFSVGGAAIPNSQAADPPYGQVINVTASNYGTAPVFPAPAPEGPYTLGMPPNPTNVNGGWALFVMDTTPGNRGVIAGGWSIEYDTTPDFPAEQTNVAIPVFGHPSGGPAPANTYPITFDLTTVPAHVPVRGVRCDLTIGHTLPDQLRIVLQSPAGTAVVLMANAGGATDIASGTVLRFFQGAIGGPVPDQSAITGNNYEPGGAYGASIAVQNPGPQPPYATTFRAFDNEQARGEWRLWVYDDGIGDTGVLSSAQLTITTENSPLLSFTTPTGTSFTANQPFVRFQATVVEQVSSYSFTWRNVTGDAMSGAFYDAGAYTRVPGTDIIYADIPVRQGTNTITTYTRNTNGSQSSAPRTATVNEFTYSLAEGATGGFFDLDVTVANPTAGPAPITTDFLLEGAGPLQVGAVVAADSPLQMRVEDFVSAAAVSTVVHSTSGVPLAVERTMIWDGNGYGGHGGTAVVPATRWLFAEGSQGFFDTYVLLANDDDSAADVTVGFLLEGGGVLSHGITVPAKTRHTLHAGSLPGLVNNSFGIDVTSTLPIIAERAMYLPGARLFEGGHESAGVNATSTRWFLAEGATGPFFDCFVLMSNPNPVAANVTLTYLLPSGATIAQDVVVPPQARYTVNVETVHPELANAAVSTTITSDVGIVAERAMYWPDISEGWQEAHNSFGVTDAALRWGVADGRIGGPRAYQTYVLLANPNPHAAEVQVRFLRNGVATVRTYTLNPTSRLNIWTNADVPELGEGTFSADIQVLNYQPIAVEKAMYWNAGGTVWAGGTNVTATRLPPP